jgi:bifunctional UDP-N-acetylglucosamine pyrophosphorylase/glucosamine-1-phosphate N-acetyltransferase
MLLPVLGRPLFGWQRDALRSHGIERIVAVVADEFMPMVSSFTNGPDQTVVVARGGPPGMLGAVAEGWKTLAHESWDAVVILEGDVSFHADDLKRVVDAIEDADAAVLVDPVPEQRPGDWITVDCQDSWVRRFSGHPRDGHLRASGVYVLGPKVVERLFRASRFGVRVPVGGMPYREYELAQVLDDAIDGGAMIHGVSAEHTVVNLDKPWQLYQANMVRANEWGAFATTHGNSPSGKIDSSARIDGVLEMGPGSYVGPGVIVRGRVHLGANSVLDSGAILNGTVWIGDESRVDEYAKVSNAVLGSHSRVSHTAEVVGGVLMDGVVLAHYCEVYGVLGESVDVGAATVFGTLRFDDARTSHRVGGRWETPEEGSNASYLGDFSRTGVNVTVLPGKSVGAYSVVGPGVVVDRDIESYRQVLVHQDWTVKEWGPERYGW